MSGMDERVAKVAEVLAGHAWVGSDEEKIDGEWTWGLNCECGEFVPGAEADAHFAAVLKPLLAKWQAEDEARGAVEVRARVEALMDRGDTRTLDDIEEPAVLLDDLRAALDGTKP